MHRHQLTLEERRLGGLNHAKKHGHQGHKLTQADRRRGGLATAAKRRLAEWAQDRQDRMLERDGVGKMGTGIKVTARNRAEVNEKTAQRAATLPPEPTPGAGLFCGCTPDSPSLACQAEGLWHGEPAKDPHTPGCAFAGDVNVAGCCEGYPILSGFGPYERISTDKLNEGSEPATKSVTITTPAPDVFAADVKAMAEEAKRRFPPMTPERFYEQMHAGDPPSIDPFTLSALKRFRLGPLSPLALTRSQRAHIEIMLAGGWVEVDAESRVRLTAKGEAALASEEDAA